MEILAFIPKHFDPPRVFPTVLSYLVFHDGLLEARPNHSLAPRLLAPAPDRLPVGRLHHAFPLAILEALLQRLVLRALVRNRSLVSRRDGGVRLLRVGVIRWDRVVGAVGGGVGAEGWRSATARESRQEPACGLLEHRRWCGSAWREKSMRGETQGRRRRKQPLDA